MREFIRWSINCAANYAIIYGTLLLLDVSIIVAVAVLCTTYSLGVLIPVAGGILLSINGGILFLLYKISKGSVSLAKFASSALVTWLLGLFLSFSLYAITTFFLLLFKY